MVSLTWDRSHELAVHKTFTVATSKTVRAAIKHEAFSAGEVLQKE